MNVFGILKIFERRVFLSENEIRLLKSKGGSLEIISYQLLYSHTSYRGFNMKMNDELELNELVEGEVLTEEEMMVISGGSKA